MNLGICKQDFKFTCHGYCRFTLSSGYTENFSLAIAMQFLEIIALLSRGKIATWLHGPVAKFAPGTIAKMFTFLIFSAIFQKVLHCQAQEI